MVEANKDQNPREEKQTKIVRPRNPLTRLQTGGRRSPFPLRIDDYGYTPWYQLLDWEKKRLTKKYSPFPPKDKE